MDWLSFRIWEWRDRRLAKKQAKAERRYQRTMERLRAEEPEAHELLTEEHLRLRVAAMKEALAETDEALAETDDLLYSPIARRRLERGEITPEQYEKEKEWERQMNGPYGRREPHPHPDAE